jgi:predicted CoA-binding protein
MSDDDSIRAALGHRGWAVVGCSPDEGRDSNRIARLLDARGYAVTPVNPAATEILERRCHPTIAEAAAAETIDVVDIFRRSDAAGAHVDEAIEVGALAIWMQLGVVDEAAAERARAAGLTVVMDRCPAIEMPRLGIDGPRAA